MFPSGYRMGGMMGVKITQSAVKHWPESLRKEGTLIYSDLLAHAHATEGGSRAGAPTALTPRQVAAAKVWVLLRKSQLLTEQ